MGIGYAWGSDEIQRTITPPNDDGTVPASVQADFSRWTFSIGFSLLGAK